jgi:hypothetical protein
LQEVTDEVNRLFDGAACVYDKMMNDHSIGRVRLKFLRIMNSKYVIALEIIWLENFNFGLAMNSPGNSSHLPSPFDARG